MKKDSGVVRTFDSGATRDTSQGKIDLEGYLSPIVLKCFGDYMLQHQTQSDGNIRASDNWQKGIPPQEYMKSQWRHHHDVWAIHRGYVVYKERIEDAEITHYMLPPCIAPAHWHKVTLLEALNGILFNVMGRMQHELIEVLK